MKRESWISSLLLVIGLLFAVLGQFYFAYRREYVWDGVLFWSIAVCSFGLLLWRTARRERGQSVRESSLRLWPFTIWVRVAGAAGGIWAVLLAGWMARQTERVDFRLPFWMWLIGVCCFLISFVWPLLAKEWRQRLAGWLRSHRRDLTG